MPQDNKAHVSERERISEISGLTSVESEGRLSVTSSYHESVAIIITLVILISGYVWGMYTRPENFVRTGSLIIITGIIFAALDLSGRQTLVDEWVAAKLRKSRPAILPASSKKDEERVKAQKDQREILEENVTSGVKEATDKARMRLRFIEVSIVILGSLIHGFGDLVVIHLRL